MIIKRLFKFIINSEILIMLNKGLNKFFFKGFYGVYNLFLPSFYFFKEIKNYFILNFLNKINFLKFNKQFLFAVNSYKIIYFFRIKLKGLGYRIKKITLKIYRFFLAFNHYFYFFSPKFMSVFSKKRNLLVISLNKILLNDVLHKFFSLKKLDFYERTNSFIIPHKILFLKK